LSVDVVKRTGVDTEGDYPQVELASRQHNHLLVEDAVAVAVVQYTALRPIGNIANLFAVSPSSST
jgi:hypothetical protein